MKRVLMVLVVLAVITIECGAQESERVQVKFARHEFSLGYGALLETDYIDVVVSISDALAGDKKSNDFYLGSISLGYSYNFNKTLSVGGKFAYAMNAYDVWRDDIKLGRERKNYYTIMPLIRANWLNRSKLRLYSYAGAGVIYSYYSMAGTANQSDCFFAFQITPLGIEIGRDWACFAELGVGQLGTFGAGVRYSF